MDVFIPPGLPLCPVDKLVPYARNARQHSKKQIEELAASIRVSGFNAPVGVRKGVVGAGNGRLEAAKLLGMAKVPFVNLDHLSDAQFRAYVIADNKIHDNSTFDETLLVAELVDLQAAAIDLTALGFDEAELKKLIPAERAGRAPGDMLLTYIDVTRGEPKQPVLQGEVWQFDKRHVLLCASVLEDWKAWSTYLEGDALFCPYPGPFVPAAEKASKRNLVMVQPDPYICGHMIDFYRDLKGKKSVKRVAP